MNPNATIAAGTPAGLAPIARLATDVWVVVSAVNVAVWLLVSVIGGSVGSPWFLWALVGGGAVVGGLHLARTLSGRARRPARPAPGAGVGPHG